MKNEKEFIGNDVVEQQHQTHARALGRPSQSGRAEAVQFGRSAATDATLSWGGGQPVAVQGREDVSLSAELERCSGISAKRISASEPPEFQKIETLRNARSGLNGVDEIARATPLSNPGVVKERR